MSNMLKLLENTYGDIGQSYVNLDFKYHPIWGKIKDLPVDTASTAIIDGTTARNTLILMQEGLANSDSFHGAMLPDMAVLFFAITHFEDLVLLDHGLSDVERKTLKNFFKDCLHVPDIWKSTLQTDENLKNDLFLKFNSIQGEFKDRNYLHSEWSDAWGKLLNVKQIKPAYFNDDLDKLLDSPSHPLHGEAKDLDRNFIEAIKKVRIWPSKSFQLDIGEQASAFASYHTFRSIFYYCLAEYVGYPYLPCGTRGIATDFLPVEYLKRETDYLNPAHHLKFSHNVMQKKLNERPPCVELPILKVQPTLAIVFEKMRQYGAEPNWPNIVSELRDESYNYRKDARDFVRACTEEGFDLQKISDLGRALGKGPDEGYQAALSTAKIAASLGKGYFTANPNSTVNAANEAIKSRPWEFIKNWTLRRRMKFVIRCAQLAANCLSLEKSCNEVWGRGLSKKERLYLERLKDAGSAFWL